LRVSQIDLESLEALAIFAASKALFILALDGTLEEEAVLHRARGLVRVVSSKMPSGVRPQILLVPEGIRLILFLLFCFFRLSHSTFLFFEGAPISTLQRIEVVMRSQVRQVLPSAAGLAKLLPSFAPGQISAKLVVFCSHLTEMAKLAPFESIARITEKAATIGMESAEKLSALQFACDSGVIL
jgi:hypothetical protein